ncbi:hypothetical protein ACF0H5_019923 [Mactra antiquata]
MGNSSSHEDDGPGTPKLETKGRVLTFDPRSPTVDISRTPIVVNKTPENILQDPLDPRSPTVGIDRTPLTGLPTSKLAGTTTDINVDILPDIVNEEPRCECKDTEDQNIALLDPLGVTGIEDLSLDDFPDSESTRLVPLDQQMLDITDKIRAKKKKTKTAQPKELFPVKLSVNSKDTTRSPLSTRTIDMNSPAKLVQRKQMKEYGRKLTCAQENSMSPYVVQEKENM